MKFEEVTTRGPVSLELLSSKLIALASDAFVVRSIEYRFMLWFKIPQNSDQWALSHLGGARITRKNRADFWSTDGVSETTENDIFEYLTEFVNLFAANHAHDLLLADINNHTRTIAKWEKERDELEKRIALLTFGIMDERKTREQLMEVAGVKGAFV